ncbi:hypothetical protein Chls_536 [Chlamydia suis]|uniref:Uncharacterized protein n=1 Tax=Chlamydia suis TaxID=83559 RepID=A0ABX6ITG1_9CHLA|nr:hypothetical protein Chls_536 [Chlamydia suis]
MFFRKDLQGFLQVFFLHSALEGRFQPKNFLIFLKKCFCKLPSFFTGKEEKW